MKRTTGKTKKHPDLRPTSNKVREALFDILRSRIEGSRFLDLYAGTGAVGLDALSESVSEVMFVEESRRYSSNIGDIIRKRHFADKAKIINKKVMTFLEWAELESLVFDIIFLDPPYHSEEIIYAMKAIDRSSILENEGIVIAEHFSKRELPEHFDNLHKLKDYHYGDTVLSFYKRHKA
jgi:16S rRNA (guanine(966)-N(2))-methyltransferase RsmD